MNARITPTPTLLASLIALALAGCAVGPDYHRPSATLPESFGEAGATAAANDGNASAATAASTANPASSTAESSKATAATAAPAADNTAAASQSIRKDWWTLFGDDTLNQLVTQAQASNQDLRLAVARVEEAEGLLREVGAAQFPSVNAQAGSSRTQVSNADYTVMPPRQRDLRTAGLSTSFEIDLWGRLRRATEAARAQALSSRYARDTVELSVAGLVSTAYLSLRAYDAEIIATDESRTSRKDSLRIANSRFEGGLASALDVAQAEGALAAADAQLASLRQQRALMQNQLALLTGQPGLTIAPGDLRQLPLPPLPPAGLPSSLIEGRPDVRQAEETLVAANAKIGVAKAAFFPQLDLTGTLGSESSAMKKLFTSPAGVWSLGLNASMPVFDMGATAARVDQASAQQKQALASYQKAVQTAFKEVMDALVTLRETGESERAQAQRVDATTRAQRIAQARYEAGYSGFLDVLDAQRSANDALVSYVDTRQARLAAVVALFKALGGGWQDNSPRAKD
ncbi:efflux transporter outer membrane subunit [Rhodocyclus tenuis]|uniref:efflux transporter outer membrane subunit n=1 Tax=Rhodocyclus gracilis TaxID=2929842 RepID=UPI0013524CCE|nr:efflux transporter outer membrane subunit [Rhodocyclus gracilis]